MGITETLLQYAPTVAGLLGGPPAAAIASGVMAIAGKVLGVQTHEEMLVALQNADPIELMQIENSMVIRLQEIKLEAMQAQLQAATSQIEAVNATMRAEAASTNWPTFTWRPFLGFAAGTLILGDFLLLPLLRMPVPAVPVEVWTFMAAVLGIASWGHSKSLADPTNTAITKG